MINVTIDKGECKKWDVYGTTTDVLAEMVSIVSNIYANVLTDALEDKTLCSKLSKKEIHSSVRAKFLDLLAYSLATIDKEVIKEQFKKTISEADNTTDDMPSSLSELMDLLFGRKEKEDGDKH